MMQIREEVAFTKGRIIVRGKLVTRADQRRIGKVDELMAVCDLSGMFSSCNAAELRGSSHGEQKPEKVSLSLY
jgi:hypothetical protein